MDEQSEIASDAAEQTANTFLDKIETLEKQLKDCRDVLKSCVDLYVTLVDCGDCGNWDPLEDLPIIKALEHLKQSEE